MERDLSRLDAALAQQLEGRDLIVFDGECVLCARFYRFVLRFDRQQRFSFATAQSPVGQALYRALGLDTRDFETNLVIVQGQIFTHLDSVTAVMSALGGLWRGIGWLRWLPAAVKTPFYRAIARNRYRIFGRFEACMLPAKAAQDRFVQGGW